MIAAQPQKVGNMNKNIKKLNDTMAQIEALKNQLKEQEKSIAADTSRSEQWKRSEVKKARATTAEMIQALYDGTSETLEALKADSTEYFNRFDYSDPKLSAAVSFVKANGAGLPENAWRAMIEDFSDRPAVLRYLAELFDSSGTVEAAMAATERASAGSSSETFPQRMDDYLFYVTGAPAESSVDFSGYRSELQAFDNAISQTAEGGGNG